MKEGLFAVSLAASKKSENRVDHVAAFCRSSTKDRAKEWAIEECLRQYPEADGWENHGVSVGLIGPIFRGFCYVDGGENGSQ